MYNSQGDPPYGRQTSPPQKNALRSWPLNWTSSSKYAEYETVLQALRIEQRELEDSLNSVVYPVLTLPNEITIKIFTGCLPAHGRVRPSRRGAPLLLAQICHHWREVALGTSELWSSVDLPAYVYGRFPEDGRVPLIETWFSRAKGHPLSLTLRATTIPSEVVSRWGALLSTFSPQLRRLELSLSDSQLRQFQSFPPFPALQYLLTYANLQDETLPPFITHSPSLRALRVHKLNIAVVTTLQSLTNLDIREHISLQMFVDVLTNLPHLLHFGCYLGGSEYPTPPAKTFPQLLSLILYEMPYGALRWVTLPGLIRLKLRNCTSDGCVIIAFLQRSNCALGHLRMCLYNDYDDSFDEEHIVDLLELCSSVSTLEVTLLRDAGPFLSGIYVKKSLLPQLQHLSISTTSPDMDYDNVIGILKQRRKSDIAVKLKSFSLKIELERIYARLSYPTHFEISVLEELIAGGLDVGILRQDKFCYHIWPADWLLLHDITSDDIPTCRLDWR